MSIRAVSVSQLNNYVAKVVEHNKSLADFYIEGELSNFNAYRSGHLYFNLKDEKSQVSCVMFRGQAQHMKFQPENGQQVVCRARAGYYEVNGKFQLYIQEMNPVGLGDLHAAFEALKEKLDKEGLFAPERKKALPFWPRRIGVVTSPSGAVIRDIINVLSRRFPGFDLLLFPAAVQGAEAPAQLRASLAKAIEYPGIETIIIGRGGGSMEDLWCFNDEGLARDIAASPIPIISAVGHETDFTICDFVSDLRAPTPSAAAELAYPVKADLLQRLAELKRRQHRALESKIEMANLRLDHLLQRPVMQDPGLLLREKSQDLRNLERRLGMALMRPMQAGEQRRQNLHQRLEQARRELRAIWNQQLAQHCARLDSLSPLRVLARGYAYVTDDEDNVLSSIEYVEVDDSLRLRLTDGMAAVRVESTQPIRPREMES